MKISRKDDVEGWHTVYDLLSPKPLSQVNIAKEHVPPKALNC